MSEDRTLPAGDFAAWVSDMQSALRGDSDAAVPCGDCTACCTASQFVHIGPDETDTLAHVPKDLLFPAPLRPKGHYVLPYDERGHCPMLSGGRCSIYEHRPRTCRTYDCRIYAATGLDVDAESETKAEIATRAGRWRFSFPTDEDHRREAAVRAAVRSVRATSVTELAVRAIETHEDHLRQEEPATPPPH
jgi:Fe-S-cluster containining protein